MNVTAPTPRPFAFFFLFFPPVLFLSLPRPFFPFSSLLFLRPWIPLSHPFFSLLPRPSLHSLLFLSFLPFAPSPSSFPSYFFFPLSHPSSFLPSHPFFPPFTFLSPYPPFLLLSLPFLPFPFQTSMFSQTSPTFWHVRSCAGHRGGGRWEGGKGGGEKGGG